ncbi:hypothetical protein MTO96_042252 [Rhipicephalus appendiculatus]
MMMFEVAVIILSVPALCAKAQETGISCPPSSALNGWGFPQVGLQDDIKWRSHVPDGTQDEECLRTITIDKNGASHLLTQTIKLRIKSSQEEITLNQTYQFYQDDQGKYNIFNTTESSPPPHGSYLFLYSDPQCAVVEYKSFTFNNAGTAERADSTSEHAVKPYCTLWVRHSTVTQSHTCCERFFNTTCDTSNLQVMYEAATCASSTN